MFLRRALCTVCFNANFLLLPTIILEALILQSFDGGNNLEFWILFMGEEILLVLLLLHNG